VLGLILVERNSSPTTAVLAGTLIGSTSLYSPVLTNTVFCTCSSAGIPLSVSAVIASVTIATKLSIILCASASSTVLSFLCTTAGV